MEEAGRGADGVGDEAGATSELAQRLQAGDRARFQELYDRLAPALYAWTHMRVGGSTAARLDPQDILQEVWLRAIRSLDRYDAGCSFRHWILGIAKNVLLQGYRSSAQGPVRMTDPLPSSRQGMESCPASVTSITTRLAKDDVVQRFLAYVSGLPDDDRMLVLYCGLEEYTCAQAAARLGITPDAASKRWQGLRARMRESGTIRALALDSGGERRHAE